MTRVAAPVATCPRDDAPLICTLAFSGAEFYCIECGGLYGWLDPNPAEESAELGARYAALKAEWEELGGNDLLGGGLMLRGCAVCAERSEPHLRHATDEEKAAHEAALQALRERAAA